MTKRKTFDELLDGRQLRRMKAEDRFLAKIERDEARQERREAEAEAMIGELCKEGRQVFYVYPVGGKYREGSRRELIEFLLRNNYA